MVRSIYTFAESGARPVPGARAPLRKTLLEAVEELQAAEDPTARPIEVQPLEEIEVATDPAVLGVIVSNLLSNALKFTRGSDVRRIAVRVASDEEHVHVEVEDNGPGVPPELEESIFQPYHRAPGLTQPGLGLGLATVKRLVLAYAGSVGVRRAASGGAIFWFELPRAPGSEEARRPQIEARAAHPPL
jgi:signal transduction histidine kinase